MIKGNISSIETMGLVDGPGIRFVVFMQGCPMRCIFCHNPETWNTKEKLLMEPLELIKRYQKYHNYYINGGITFTGGEPLMQPEFLIETLKICKNFGIHTCLDTSGFGIGKYEEILKYIDLVIYDIKALEPTKYFEITGKNINESLKFLEICEKMNVPLWIRQVIVPGINDNEEYILKLKEYISTIKNVEKIELLPYHTMGTNKYEQLGIPYRLKGTKDMSNEKVNELYKILID